MIDQPNSSRSILVLGAGELGFPVLLELAKLPFEPGTALSVLLPPLGEAPAESALARRAAVRALGADIIEADLALAGVGELADIFSRFTQVVGCTGFVGGPGTQRKITAAALKADLEHYVPWQFGVDYDVVGHGSGQEVFDEQLEVRGMLRSQSTVQWTIISTGMFTSFVFLPAFGLVDLQSSTVHALGRWEHQLTVTTPEDIGRVTALVVAAYQEHADQIVYVAGDTFTYRELANTLETVLGRRFERVLWTVPELQAAVAAHPDDTMRKYRLAFAREDGVAWPIAQTFNARQQMPMVDVAAWLRSHQAPPAPPAGVLD